MSYRINVTMNTALELLSSCYNDVYVYWPWLISTALTLMLYH